MTYDKSALEALLARVEAATGPDDQLDEDLWLATTPGATLRVSTITSSTGKWKPYELREQRWSDGHLLMMMPKVTASLDACAALAEHVVPGRDWKIRKGLCGKYSCAEIGKAGVSGWFRLDGLANRQDNEIALAFLAAIIRALIAQGDAP